MTTHRNEPATSTFGGRRLAHTRAAMVAFMLLALIPLLARSAAADACTAGCKVAAKACRLSGKIEAKGCYRSCQAVFAASDFEEADKLAYVACKSSCKAELASDVSACETIGSTCSASCDSSACAETCGTILNGCSSLTLAATKACAGSCAGNGACLQACSEPGSVAAHHGDAALADCLFHPTHGYSICRTSGCAALCGNTIQEPGEACDDGGTTDGDGCSATCILEGADGDVIASDGDNSGTAGDNPCSGGNTVNCDDNCPFHANPTQIDSDGDGVGDICDYNCNVATGASIAGGVYLNSVAPANLLAGAYISACTSDGACCSYTTSDSNGAYQFSNLPVGSYHVVSHAPAAVLPNGIGPLVVSTGSEMFSNENFVHIGPQPVPPGTTLNGTNGTIPSVVPGVPQQLTTTGCPGGTATYAISQNGVSSTPVLMIETPSGSGFYEATIPAGSFVGGAANQVLIEISCPNPIDDESFFFDVYIDPSGFTRFLNGDGAAGAMVTLLRSDTPIGPFEVVPNGSAIMSPKNRNNPDLSDAAGHFGWDVMAGYYQVRAEIGGCLAESRIMEIPPEVTDLELVFHCPCIAGPQAGCRTADKGQLTINNNLDDDSKDSFQWKWSNGQASTQADFGSPLTTTNYDVCVYSGGSIPLSALTIPADPISWTASGSTGTAGYKYGDTLGLNSGVRKVVFKASSENKTSLLVKGKGVDLPDATLGSVAQPITVQLQRHDSGLCFESTFDMSNVVLNTSEKLKLKRP